MSLRPAAVAALLLALLLTGCASAPSGGPSGGAASPIDRVQIEAARSANVYDLVQTLRPNWLRTRGVNSFRESAQGRNVGRTVQITPGTDMLIVYLDNARLGGVETLRQISSTDVVSVRFLDAAAATHRWGAGHSHGAILVSTRIEG